MQNTLCFYIKKDDNPNKERHELLQSSVERYKKDGLSSLKYIILNKKFYRLYTWVLVKVNETNFN